MENLSILAYLLSRCLFPHLPHLLGLEERSENDKKLGGILGRTTRGLDKYSVKCIMLFVALALGKQDFFRLIILD